MATSAVMMEISHDATAAERQILLVGASRGLGLALTKLFAANHWKVVATERRSGATSELKAAAAAADGRIRIERVDINDLEQVHGLHQQLSGKLFDVIFYVPHTPRE
jgi:NAD(P)-dependent dehydrogenase (short-subunit alcohol dehydrogenase family)